MVKAEGRPPAGGQSPGQRPEKAATEGRVGVGQVYGVGW